MRCDLRQQGIQTSKSIEVSFYYFPASANASTGASANALVIVSVSGEALRQL